MRLCKITHANILPAGKIFRSIAAAGLMLLVSAATVRAQANDGTGWVRVSMNAGETYVINDVKPGTKPSIQVDQNPNAFVTYDSPPGKLTILSAEAGRWIVTVTSTSDQTVSYDIKCVRGCEAWRPADAGQGAAVDER